MEDKERLLGNKLASTRIHFFYIVLILIGGLILMATRNWTRLQGFTEYLSVSATITSLVLGVLAIIYGFVSSNSTTNFLGSVEVSAREMKSVGSQLRDLLSKGHELQEKAGSRNEELHVLIESLRSTIENLTTSTTSIAGAVEKLPVKIDTLRSEILQNASSSMLNSEQTVSLEKNDIKDFLSVSSILGLVALYALLQAKNRTKPADLERIFKSKYIDSKSYAQGFLVASSCMGLVNFELEKGSYWAIKISFSEGVEDLIQSEWNHRKESSDEDAQESIKKYEAIIEESFSSAPVAS